MGSIPVTVSGKVDKGRLPKVEEAELAGRAAYVGARNETEAALVKIWEEVLSRVGIGVEDNFFEIGGHSLVATQVIAHIRKEMGVELGIRELFDRPTIGELAGRIGAMRGSVSAEGRELLGGIGVQERPERIPLSFAQERLWFIDRLEGSVQYHIPTVLRLRGELDVVILEQALRRIVDRHEVLRTVIGQRNGVAGQQVEAPGQWRLGRIDGAGYEENEAGLQERIAALIQRPFDLSGDAMLRADLIGISDREHVLVVTLHHIASDGWSASIIVREMVELYDAGLGGRAPVLAELPIQYSDYAIWERRRLAGGVLEEKLGYWKEKLLGAAPMELPTDRPRPAVQSSRGGSLGWRIDKELMEELQALSRAEGATMFMTLLSAFKVLLYRYSGQEDIVVGSPVAGRRYRELEGLVGFFINTLVLRSTLNGEMSYRALLQQVRETTLAAYEHQDVPFEKVVEVVVRERDTSRSPLFQVLFVLQNTPEVPQLRLGEVQLSMEGIADGVVKYDLDFTLAERPEGLELSVQYRSDLYERETVERMLVHYEWLLRSIVAEPGQQISRLELLTAAERKQLTEGFNATAAAYPKDKTVVELFEEQVWLTPEAVAMVSGEEELSYRELNERSNRLGHYLRRQGVREETLVPVCLERSAEMIVGILGILKAGGAYVPVDLEYPAERIGYILADTGARVVISHPELLAKIKLRKEVQIIDPDILNSEELIINPKIAFHSDPLFCMVYTSGSSGMPKGVQLQQSAILNRLYWMWRNYPFGEHEKSALKTSIGFADHIWELFGPLLKGVPSVLFKKEHVYDLDVFTQKLSEHKISRLVLVPSLLRSLLNKIKSDFNVVECVRYWTCSGEALDSKLVSEFYDLFSVHKHVLLNIYGSTEVMADATCYSVVGGSDHTKENGLVSPFDLSIKKEIELLIEEFNARKQIVRSNTDLNWLQRLNDVEIDDAWKAEEYIDFLRHDLLPHVIKVSAPGYIGHMTGVIPEYLKELNALMIELNQNVVKVETSFAATAVERQVIGTIHHQIFKLDKDFYSKNVHHPSSCLGVITNGGTLSNITALNVALNKAFPADNEFKGIKVEGLFKSMSYYNYKGIAVIGSRFMHYSINKSMQLLGLGNSSYVTFDFGKNDLENGARLLMKRIEELRRQNILVLAIIGIAGSTETGRVDPLMIIGRVAREMKIHYHIDAAFGGAYVFSSKLAYKLQGIEHADSVSICGHKQLLLPIGASVCVFKSPYLALCAEQNSYYQARKGGDDLGRFTIEGSRPFTALLFHSTFKLLGVGGLGKIIESNFDATLRLAEKIRQHECFELLETPELNILIYRFIPPLYRNLNTKNGSLSGRELAHINEVNKQLQQVQFLRGNSFVSYSEIFYGTDPDIDIRTVALRVVIMNPYTGDHVFDSLLSEQVQIADEILTGHRSSYSNNFFLTIDAEVADKEQKNTPIGKPIDNIQAYILDNRQELMPIGVPGEICIGGAGLARGYWKQAELTAEKFVANPYRPGERLYRTGDRGRWLKDGNIEYLGRLDTQVKIRGYRIEPGEVESLLQQHASVRNCVVVAREDGVGQKRLVGYVVPRGVFDKAVLQAYLKEHLPEYMVPSLLVEMGQMPLTSSGKVDRKALPAPDMSVLLQQRYEAPRTESERVLAEIWQELLGIERVGIHDDFFELGGHSLLATRVVSAIRSRLGKELGIRTLFTHSTIIALAGLVQQEDETMERSIGIQERPEEIPLSYSQERMWFIDQFGGSEQYHMPAVLRLRGELDVVVLERALRGIVDRHEVLRTVIGQRDGVASQRVQAPGQWRLGRIDGRGLGQDEAGLRERIAALMQKPFDLSRDAMLRADLIGISDREHVLVVTLHHIASDGWSTSIIVGELAELYNAGIEGRAAVLAELPVQYVDYTLWQRRYLEEGGELERQLGYWRDQLRGLAALELPADRVRPAVQSMRGARRYYMLEAGLMAELKALSQREGVTLYMTLLSVFKVLLFRYSGQEDIAVGSSIAGRRQRELEGLIGFFVNTLVLRSDLGGDPTFRALLGRVKVALLEAYEHQDVPFERVVDAVVKERDLSRSPLFQVLFELLNTPERPAFEMGGVRLEMEPAEGNTSKFDIEFGLWESEQGASVSIEYCTDLFEESTIERMFRHYVELLRSVSSNVETKIKDLNMLEKEEEAWLAGLNETAHESAAGGTLVGLFEGQVQRDAEAIALIADGARITYDHLHRQSNKVAQYLKARGVGRGHYVTANATASIGTIINIIGIIKTGAAYVPIDPGWSAERKQWILQVLNITEAPDPGLYERLRDVLSDDATARKQIDPDAVACVLYSADDRGTAILQSHRLIAGSIRDVNQRIGLGSGDRVIGINNLTGALSLYDIFGPLTSGASLVLVADTKNIGQLAHAIVNNGISILHTTPSVVSRLLVKSGDILGAGCLRYILLSGERVPLFLPDRIKERFPRALVAALGTVRAGALWSTFYPIDVLSSHLRSIPIGRPIGDQQVYVLDDRLRPCPFNIRGQLYVRGPFGNVYQSGRAGLIRKDGNLEFFEQVDDGQKIGGHTIEVSKIEQYLAEMPGVWHAVAAIKEYEGGEKRIAGYTISGHPIHPERIRMYLSERLPEYMLPDFIMAIDDLPLTEDGRLDKSRLPDRERGRSAGVIRRLPGNKVEETLLRIYAALLQRADIGITDNFFEIGGNSMYAVQIITHIFKEFHVELRLRDIFDFPTIEGISVLIGARHKKKHFKIGPIGGTDDQELSHAQERLFVADQLSGGDNAAYNIPGVFTVGSRATKEVIEDIFNRIIQRHENLRTVFIEKDGIPYGRIRADVYYEIEEIDLSGEADKDPVIGHYVNLNLHRRFDLSMWPLFEMKSLRLDPSTAIILFSMHHIISDGWSMELLEKEFLSLYNNYVLGQRLEIEPLTLQYKDYVAWHNKFLESDAIIPYKEYWMRRLSDPVPGMNLFIDKPRPKRPTFRSTSLGFEVPAGSLVVLRDIGHKSGASLFMCLIAIVKMHLRQLTKQDDIIIGIPSSGRVHPDLEHVVGFFVNILPLRTMINGDETFENLVKEVRRTVLDAYDNQIYPFDKMVDDLLLTREVSRNPLFDIMVAYEDVQGEPKVGEIAYSKYDITINLWAGDNLQVLISFNNELFDQSSMLLFRDQLKALFDEVLMNDNRTVDQFVVGTGVSNKAEAVDFKDDFFG
jgi:putative pyridoxal-dependent aspartate 1-decarboxylase